MTPSVNKLFLASRSDKEFQTELSVHEPQHYKPSLFWDSKQQTIYATIYMGWLIGKRRYNESDFL